MHHITNSAARPLQSDVIGTALDVHRQVQIRRATVAPVRDQIALALAARVSHIQWVTVEGTDAPEGTEPVAAEDYILAAEELDFDASSFGPRVAVVLDCDALDPFDVGDRMRAVSAARTAGFAVRLTS